MKPPSRFFPGPAAFAFWKVPLKMIHWSGMAKSVFSHEMELTCTDQIGLKNFQKCRFQAMSVQGIHWVCPPGVLASLGRFPKWANTLADHSKNRKCHLGTVHWSKIYPRVFSRSKDVSILQTLQRDPTSTGHWLRLLEVLSLKRDLDLSTLSLLAVLRPLPCELCKAMYHHVKVWKQLQLLYLSKGHCSLRKDCLILELPDCVSGERLQGRISQVLECGWVSWSLVTKYSQVNLVLKISGQEKMPLVEVPKTMPPYIATNPGHWSIWLLGEQYPKFFAKRWYRFGVPWCVAYIVCIEYEYSTCFCM